MKARALHLVPKAHAEATDTVALERVARGDVSALGGVYDRHAAALVRFAARAAGHHDAEDLVQAAFVTAARIAGTYDGRTDSARSWLYGIVARLIQERRRSVVRFARAVLRAGHGSPSAYGPPDSHRSDLERGLRALSAPKRIVILLAEVEGYTCEEIARTLGVPIGTVWTRLHHARKELRAFYEEERR